MDRLNKLLRDLISEQDTVTHYNEKTAGMCNGSLRDEYLELMREHQAHRDHIRAQIMALFESQKWDYDEAMRQYDAQQKRACDAEAKLPCGHPAIAIRGVPDFPGDTHAVTQYCGWCADVAQARQQERERCAELALKRCECEMPYHCRFHDLIDDINEVGHDRNAD